jgi:hypothetical protein
MSSDVDEPSISEDDCAVCGDWPAADREGMRMLLDRIPLHDGVCDLCQMEFWRGLGLFDLFAPPTKH